jgi:dynein heavy chain
MERSKTAQQATMIVRHETQKRLYVNFDVDIMQLTRVAKCLGRQGIPIP